MESTLLTQIFDFYASRKPKFGCTWVAEGTRWNVLPTAIQMSSVTAPNTKVVSYAGLPVSEKLKENPSAVYPENLFTEIAELEGPFNEFLMMGNVAVSIDGRTVVDLPVEFPIRHHEVLCGLVKERWKDFATAALCYEKQTKTPILKLTTEKEAIWIAVAKISHPEELKIEVGNTLYIPDCWNDIEKCYTKVREENMNLNVNTSKMVTDILGVSPEDIKVDPNKAGKDMKVKTAEKIAEEPVKEPVKEPQEAPKEEQEAPKEVPQEAPVKRTRKKADTTPVTDLTKVIDQLGGAVPEGLSAEEAQQAIRQLRDLMQKAASRMANISLKYIESTEGAVAKLAAIKAAL